MDIRADSGDEWQPARIAPYDDSFHYRNVREPAIWKSCVGMIIRVQPYNYVSANAAFCSGKSFKVHPDDVRKFPNSERLKGFQVVLCEHQIQTD